MCKCACEEIKLGSYLGIKEEDKEKLKNAIFLLAQRCPESDFERRADGLIAAFLKIESL